MRVVPYSLTWIHLLLQILNLCNCKAHNQMDSNSWVGDVTVLAGLKPCGAFCQGKSGALCQLTDMSLRMQQMRLYFLYS